MIARLPLLMILLAGLASATGIPASAQDAPPPDIVMEKAELTDAVTGKTGPFLPGSDIDITIHLMNRGRAAVDLRRIVLRASSMLEVADPVGDTLDNDADGEVDERDEAFHLRNDDGVAWRLMGDGLRLQPGGRLTRMVRVSVRETALPGTSGVLSLSAGSTLAEAERSRPQRTLHLFPVPLAPPVLSLALSGADKIDVSDPPLLAAAIVIPGGILSDAVVTLDLPPALDGKDIERLRIGSAIACGGDSEPQIAGKTMTLRLGRCRIDPAAEARDRTVRFSLTTTVTDADPAGSDAEIAAWRDIAATLTLRNGDIRLGRTVRNAALSGPLLKLEAALPAGARYRPGDMLPASLRIVNRGNAPLPALRLRIAKGGTFLCETVSVGEDIGPEPCADGIMLSSVIEPGESLDIALEARLRNDALIEADTGMEVQIEGSIPGPLSFPVIPVAMVPHDAPRIVLDDPGEWSVEDTITTATIGQGAKLRISGSLPPGRYRGDIRLLARMIDARTGAPVAPAGLTIKRPDLSILDADGSTVGTVAEMTETHDTVWSQSLIPFDLRDEMESAGEDRSFTATVDVALADDPALQSNRLMEIIAESTAYGDTTVSGSEWIEVLVAEPDLRLKLFSLDDDRVIHPGEALGVTALVCNYGDSPAFGTRLVVDLPSRFDLASDETRKRAFTVPLEAVRTGDVADLPSGTAAPGQSRLAAEASRLTLDTGDAPLQKDECVGIELSGPLGADRIAVAPTVDVIGSLGSYRGNADPERTREYSGAETQPLRFIAPAIRFGPSTMIQLGEDRRIAHPVELVVPPWLGPFRVSLSPESSAGLEWTLFERGEDGQLTPWMDGAGFTPGSTVQMVMRTVAPDRLPLGWVDTSRLRTVVLTGDGRSFGSTLRLVIRSGTGSARTIDTDKRVALDRDCDGSLADEHAQNAVFESTKDAAPGDCLIVRIAFENTGLREVERIVIRDVISTRTTLLPGSPSVRIAPEPLDSMTSPDPGGALQWEFEGLFRPGAVGEVEYHLRLNPSPGKSLK